MARARPTTLITPDLLIRAYSVGLFPMAEAADDDRLFWVDPDKRGIFPLEAIRVSASLAKTVRSDRFTILADHDFPAVIAGCAQGGRAARKDTWINSRIRALFGELFARGDVHTVEAYCDGALVGGLYGLHVGGAFFGESMFHRATDASKVCLVHLAARLRAGGFELLDAQFITPHLATLGAVEVSKGEYHRRLARAMAAKGTFTSKDLPTRMDGWTALAILREGAAGR